MKEPLMTFDRDKISVEHKPEGENELVRIKIQRTLGEPDLIAVCMLANEADALAVELLRVSNIAKLHRRTRETAR